MHSSGGRRQAVCEVWMENQDGEKTTVGTASVFLTDEQETGECE